MYNQIEQCLCCGNDNLFVVLDLNNQPPANSFHTETESPDNYELKLMGCDSCWHTQLSIAVDPAELFKHYLYVSGTSKTLKDYFDWFAGHYTEATAGKVLDIACNDGTQLDSFKQLGWTTYGVDPAENLFAASSAKGHSVTCDFWSTEVAQSLPEFDLIVAQNVFAHTANINEFLQACKTVMHNDTTLVIQTSQANMFDNNEFDTIYHEHISFFSTLSMKTVCERNGLHLNNVYKTDIHGTSYVFEIGLAYAVSGSVESHLMQEQTRYSKDFFEQYRSNAINCLNQLKTFVDINRLNKRVVGYGAAAKGMTVLNAGSIKLDYIVDDNPLKQGLLSPGINIPIVSNQQLIDSEEDIIIIPLAWNFYDEICKRVKELRPNNKDLFVRYFPHFNTAYI